MLIFCPCSSSKGEGWWNGLDFTEISLVLLVLFSSPFCQLTLSNRPSGRPSDHPLPVFFALTRIKTHSSYAKFAFLTTLLWTKSTTINSQVNFFSGAMVSPQTPAGTTSNVPPESATWTRFLPEAFGIREGIRNNPFRWCVREVRRPRDVDVSSRRRSHAPASRSLVTKIHIRWMHLNTEWRNTL